MKIIKTKKIAFGILAGILVLISGVFQSCNSDMDATQGLEKGTNVNNELSNSEENKIVNSIEFEEYIKATADLATVLQNIDARLKKTGLTNNSQEQLSETHSTSSSNLFYIDQNLLERVSSKKAILIDKYPSFQKLSLKSMQELINMSLKKNRIYKIFNDRGLFKIKPRNLRMKVSSPEGSGTSTYSNLSDFVAAATAYDDNKECAGFKLADGSFVLYISPTATEKKTQYPSFTLSTDSEGNCVSMYDGKEIVQTYHTQPSSFSLSTTDKESQANAFENMPATVLYYGTAYTYNFQGGQMTNTSSIAYADGSISIAVVNSNGTTTVTHTTADGITTVNIRE